MTIVDKNYSIAAMINESKQLLNANTCSTYMYMLQIVTVLYDGI